MGRQMTNGRNVAAVLWLVSGLMLSECSSDTRSALQQGTAALTDDTPPSVLAFLPGNGAADVPLDTGIAATFSEALEPTTVNESTFTVSGLSGTVSYVAESRKAVFTPSTALAHGTLYTATITADVTDLAGNHLAAPAIFTFTTLAVPSAPRVTKGSPLPNVTDVALNPTVVVTFAEPVDPLTINTSAFTLTGPSGQVSSTVFYDAANLSGVLVPTIPLDGGATYTVNVTTKVANPSGVAMATPVSWSFTVAASDTTAPSVLLLSPVSGAIGIPTSSAVTALFSEAIDRSSLDVTTFSMNGVPGAVTYDPATHRGTFTPAAALASGTPYTAILTTGVKDVVGNAMAAPASWTLTTASLYSGYVSNISTLNDYCLLGWGNAWISDATGKPRGLTFSWDVDQVGDLWRYRYTLYGNDKGTNKWVSDFTIGAPRGFSAADLLPGWSLVMPIDGVVTDVTSAATAPTPASQHDYIDGSIGNATSSIFGIQWITNESVNYYPEEVAGMMFVLIFKTPRAPMWGDFFIQSGAQVNCGTTGCAYGIAKDLEFGNPTDFAASNGNHGGWALVPGSLPVDDVPPTVQTIMPADRAADVLVGSTITAIFSEAIAQATLNNSTFIVNGPSGAVSGALTYDASLHIATFTPAALLSYSTDYTVTVTAAVTDMAGNAMAVPKTWTFTTAAHDTDKPTVTSTSPAAEDINVAVDSVVTATFSKAIDPSTLTSATFTLRNDTGTVNGTVSYDATSRTATFNPGANGLTHGATYTATLTTGVRDRAGNALMTLTNWEFSTAFALGDVDGNGFVDAADVELALQIVVGNVTPTGEQSAAADVAPLLNGAPHPDGAVNVGDLVVLLRKVTGDASW